MIKPFTIRKIDGLVTSVDIPDANSNTASWLMGGVSRIDGAVFTRDFGTKQYVPSTFTGGCPVPIRPNAFKTISGAVSGTGSKIRLTITGHGLSAGNIYVDEVTGTIEANGYYPFTVVDADHIELTGSTFANAYVSGGIASQTPISIVKHTIFHTSTGTPYLFIAGLDSNNLLRHYIYDSGWQELSRYFTALINGTPSASAQVLTFDTGKENGTTFTFGTDTVKNYVVVNTSKSNQTVFVTASTSTTITTDTVLGSSGLGWADNDVLEIYKFPCYKFNYTYSCGATPFVNFGFVESQNKMIFLYQSTDGTKHQALQIMKRDARSYFYTAYGGSAQRTLPAGWYCESDFGTLNPYFTQEGTIDSPNTNFGGDKYTLEGATNASPISIKKTGHGYATNDVIIIKNVLGNTAANGYWVITKSDNDNFTLNNSTGNGTFSSSGEMVKVGTTSTKTGVTNIYDQTSGRNWLQIYSGKGTYEGSDKNVRIYITVTFDDYQESDPIFQGMYHHTTYISMIITLGLNFALMNKCITKINIYATSANDTVYSGGWNDSASEYKLIYSQNTQSSFVFGSPIQVSASVFWNPNSFNALPYYGYTSYDVSSNEVMFCEQGGAETIISNLNHQPIKERSYPTPRYYATLAGTQGALRCIDIDDQTLAFSLWDGVNNQDDNFPDSETDESGNRLRAFLSGTGTIYGLGVTNDTFHAIRNLSREWYDPQGNTQGILPCDCVSRDSIIQFPYGLTWAGDYSIYLLENGAGQGAKEETFNGAWQNIYDGTKCVTGLTPYITSSYRQAIVSGYSKIYDSIYYLVKMNTATGTEYVAFVFSFSKKPLSGQSVGWYQRKFNIGTDGSIKSFAVDKSTGNLTLSYATGVLQYPNRSGSYLYQDDVLVNGAGNEISQSKGIPTKIKIDCGEVYNIVNKMVFDKLRIDYVGSSISGTGKFNTLIYINKKTTAEETKTFSIDGANSVRRLPLMGALERLSIELNLTSGQEYDFKDLNISTIEFGTAQTKEMGNQ